MRERRRLGAPAALPPEGAAADLLADAVHAADAPPPPVGRAHRRLEAAPAVRRLLARPQRHLRTTDCTLRSSGGGGSERTRNLGARRFTVYGWNYGSGEEPRRGGRGGAAFMSW